MSEHSGLSKVRHTHQPEGGLSSHGVQVPPGGILFHLLEEMALISAP